MTDDELFRSLAKNVELGKIVSPTLTELGTDCVQHPVKYGTYRKYGGLCHTLGALYNADIISVDQMWRCRRAITSCYCGGQYYSPLTPEGDTQRVALCINLARLAAENGGNLP